MEYKVFCRYEDFRETLNFYLFQDNENGGRELCTNLKTMEFKPIKRGEFVPEPTFSISGCVVQPFLKAMANALDEIGIRPEGKPVLENELTATKYHLEDMREIAFGQFNWDRRKTDG
jgi:hypothetical protein